MYAAAKRDYQETGAHGKGGDASLMREDFTPRHVVELGGDHTQTGHNK